MNDTNRSRVVAFVREHHPKPVCAQCVAVALNIRPNASQRVATLLEGKPGFVRQFAICGVCGQRRLVVRAVSRLDAAPS